MSARFIDASRYLSRDSYRDTVCKYHDTLKKKTLDTIILDTETAYRYLFSLPVTFVDLGQT